MNVVRSIVLKLIRFQVAVSNVDLKVARYTQEEGYVATVHHENMKKSVELYSGIILVEIDHDAIEAEINIGNEASLANII